MIDPKRAAPPSPARLREEILQLVEARGLEASICPSEVARLHGENWQRLMTPVRNAARLLAREGRIEILRKGKPIDPDAIKGVIRLRLRPPGDNAPEAEMSSGDE